MSTSQMTLDELVATVYRVLRDSFALEALRAERDALRERLAATEIERDALRARFTAIEKIVAEQKEHIDFSTEYEHDKHMQREVLRLHLAIESKLREDKP